MAGKTRQAAGSMPRGRVSTTPRKQAAPNASGSGGGGRRGHHGPALQSVTSRVALLALVLVVLLVSYAYPLRSWYDQRSERHALEEEKAQLRESVDDLEAQLELWNDPAYVEAQARQRLGFVMPGEQGYVVIPETKKRAAEGEPTVEGLPPAETGEWHERLWSSFKAADETAPPEDSKDPSD